LNQPPERLTKLDDFGGRVKHFLATAGATVGYTLFFRSGTANGFNFGGGVNYWFREHLGLRLEFRDNVSTTWDTEHYLGFRVGLAFR
jgi:hypothetical protein